MVEAPLLPSAKQQPQAQPPLRLSVADYRHVTHGMLSLIGNGENFFLELSKQSAVSCFRIFSNFREIHQNFHRPKLGLTGCKTWATDSMPLGWHFPLSQLFTLPLCSYIHNLRYNALLHSCNISTAITTMNFRHPRGFTIFCIVQVRTAAFGIVSQISQLSPFLGISLLPVLMYQLAKETEVQRFSFSSPLALRLSVSPPSLSSFSYSYSFYVCNINPFFRSLSSL